MMIRRNLKRRAAEKVAPVNTNFSQYMTPPEECELPFVTVSDKKKYTKTEINRLPTSELRELAKENGIDNANENTGAELKKMLIEKFGL